MLSTFFAAHPVFSLKEAALTLAPGKNRRAMVDRLKYHVKRGSLLQVTRGIYAVVPAGEEARNARPDPFLVGLALRSDAVFSHHSALELLGASHSSWNALTFFSARPRTPLSAGGMKISTLRHPKQMFDEKGLSVGTRKVERRGTLVVVTGPERTLVEGFRRPSLVGGLEELMTSAGGFPVLDLQLLQHVLERYDEARLWAATGWFLERFRKEFSVPEDFLSGCEKRRPAVAQYLERASRGGALSKRWNLILPRSISASVESHEP